MKKCFDEATTLPVDTSHQSLTVAVFWTFCEPALPYLIRSFEILQQTERQYNVKYMEYGDQNLHSSWTYSWCESLIMSRKTWGKTKTLTICNRVDRRINLLPRICPQGPAFQSRFIQESLSIVVMPKWVHTWVNRNFGTTGFQPMVQ